MKINDTRKGAITSKGDIMGLLLPVALIHLICLGTCGANGCFTCENPLIGKNMCQHTTRKEVDFSGVCTFGACKSASCSHQLGLNGSNECVLHKWDFCDATEDVFNCDGLHCSCPETVEDEPSSLEQAVTISAYPFQCACTVASHYASQLGVRVQLTGWTELGLVYKLPDNHKLPDDHKYEPKCRLFRLSGEVAGSLPPSAAVEYDCPNFRPHREGHSVEVQLCTRDHSVRYQLRLPLRSEIEGGAWQPLPVHHKHRSDRLVFSVQRAPPSLCTRRFHLQLVSCSEYPCSSGRAAPIADTDRTVQEACSESEATPGAFLVEYEWPANSGNMALKVTPEGRNATYSVIVHHDAVSYVGMWVLLTVLLLILVLAVGFLVWLRKFYQPALPDLVRVLVVYNSNRDLARRLAACLQRYCRISTRLDVVDIPLQTEGMDPASWLQAELAQCQCVLLLVFPSMDVPPIYHCLYSNTVHHLQIFTDKKVVVGYSGSGDEITKSKKELPRASRCQLPEQLGQLVATLRGVGGCSWRRLLTAELTRQLRCSTDGKELCRLLENPKLTPPSDPEVAAGVEPLLPPLQLPRPPARPTDKMAKYVPDLDYVLSPPAAGDSAQNGPTRPALPKQADDGDDDEIEWY